MPEAMINNSMWLNLLWVVAGLVVLVGVGFTMRRRAMRLFAGSAMLRQLAPQVSDRRRYFKAGFVLVGLIALVLALIDPRWGREWRELPQRGVDVIFVLDVSRSMLADDASPNRLDRAKRFIGDMVDAMDGDRVGLVTYAGSVSQRVPLTNNYQDFMLALDEVGPHSVPRGGSLLGEAIGVASERFLDQAADHKAIVVISDGEDQGSDPVSVAEAVFSDKGIRVYTVGIGDPDQGSRIPIRTVAYRPGETRYMQYDGQDVVTRMDGQTLEQIAMVGGGAYIPAETMSVDMGTVYHTHLTGIAQRDFESTRVNTYIPRFQWFAAAALILLVLDTLVSDRRRKAVTA